MAIQEIIESSRDILESLHDGVAIVDTQEIVVYVNNANYRITGRIRDEFIGHKVSQVVPQSSLPEVLRTGRAMIGHRTLVDDKEVVSNIVPIRKNGTIIGAISIFKDITDVILLSKELEEARHRIAHLNEKLHAAGVVSHSFVAGSSRRMKEALELAVKAARTSSTILLEGESGTGKEVIARYIHQISPRREKAFMAVNCAAIPAALLESELFGYEEGAFTGARKGGRPGLFELASGGTLFLDEIGEMDILLQAKLLRALQETTIRRVGSGRDTPIDVRLISASNRDLWQLVQQHKLREDLYYRLEVVRIRLPPLRERKEDLHLYIEHVLRKISNRLDKPVGRIDRTSWKALMQYDYPGNIRELENIIELSLIMDEDGVIGMEDLPDVVKGSREPDAFSIDFQKGFPSIRELEELVIKKALLHYSSKQEAAKALGITRATLYRKMRDYDSINV